MPSSDENVQTCFSLLNAKKFPEALSAFKKLNDEDQKALSQTLIHSLSDQTSFDFLLDIALMMANQLYNSILLKKLDAVKNEKDLANHFQEKINALSEDDKKVIEILLSIESENDSKLIYENMQKFLHFGDIDYDGGLLACAQVASRKAKNQRYDFNPVVLKIIPKYDSSGSDVEDDDDLLIDSDTDFSQLQKFLKNLKKAPHPCRERFVIAGSHWICGDISITEDNQVSVLFMDSFGRSKINEFDTADVMKIFHHTFPTADIYFADLLRQNTTLGCSVFALDDVRHLFTVDDYLDPNVGGLHDYLNTSAEKMKKTFKLGKATIKECELPLSLIRTMQSTSLLDLIDERKDEAKWPVNIHRELLTRGHSEVKFFRQTSEGLRNLRLEHTLSKIRMFNLMYLKEMIDNHKSVEAVTEPFTLKGYKKRLKSAPQYSLHRQKAAIASEQKEQKDIEKLFSHIVNGEASEVEKMLKAKPSLALVRCQSEKTFVNKAGQRIKIQGKTGYQLALGEEDTEITQMFENAFIKVKNEQELSDQFHAQRPDNWQQEEEKRWKPIFEQLDILAKEIKEAAPEDIIASGPPAFSITLNEDSKVAVALQQFHTLWKEMLEKEVVTGRHFNPEVLLHAFNLYQDQYYNVYKIKDNFCADPRGILFSQQVIGYIERFMPANYVQAFCESIAYTVEKQQNGQPQNREFKLDTGDITNPTRVNFYPLAPDSGLGFNYSMHERGMGVTFAFEPSYPSIFEVYNKQKQHLLDISVTVTPSPRRLI